MVEGSNTISIRTAEVNDVPRITSLAVQLGYPNSQQEIMDQLLLILSDATQTVLVADADGKKTVGFVHLHIRNTLVSAPVVELSSLVVDESLRGRGIGKELVLFSGEWSKNQGFSRIRLNTNIKRERAHNFYTNLGFKNIKSQHVFQKDLD